MKVRRVIVAVSGGVDSLCATLLLKRRGYDVLALHARLAEKPPEVRDSREAALARACHKLNVPLEIVDLREFFFSEIIHPFISAFASGQTPNPCAACNRKIKFGVIREAAMRLGANYFATGHYVSLVSNPYGDDCIPGPARDFRKDQSYFLALVPGTCLQDMLFPCAAFLKSEIRAIIEEEDMDLPEPGESQDICFAEGSPQKLLAAEMRGSERGGPILLKQSDGSLKQLARHEGLWKYTRGQRKGLCIPGPEAWYVLEKRADSNELVIGPRSMLAMTGCRANRANYFVTPEKWPEKLWIKCRYRQEPLAAKVFANGDELIAQLEKPAFPGAEGQVLAVYDSSARLLAGAVTSQVFMTSGPQD